MAENPQHTRQSQTDAGNDTTAEQMNEPVPAPDDPGGAHRKGYSADPRPEAAVDADGPVPLADGPDAHPAFRVPERDNNVRPTGRGQQKGYPPNDRLMGSDR